MVATNLVKGENIKFDKVFKIKSYTDYFTFKCVAKNVSSSDMFVFTKYRRYFSFKNESYSISDVYFLVNRNNGKKYMILLYDAYLSAEGIYEYLLKKYNQRRKLGLSLKDLTNNVDIFGLYYTI